MFRNLNEIRILIKNSMFMIFLEDCWHASPQLFFACHLCTSSEWPPKTPIKRIRPDDVLFSQVFFSSFEELKLPIHGPMEDARVPKQ